MESKTTLSPRVHTGQWVVESTAAMPENAIHVRDGGGTVVFTWTYLQGKPRDVVWNQNFGCLGTGLPYAVGASIADGGKRPVLFTTSDSAFLYHSLSDKPRPIGDRWAIEVGRYAGIGPMNQGLLSPTGNQARAIEPGHLAAASNFLWLTPRM